jgi:hypothetical protein
MKCIFNFKNHPKWWNIEYLLILILLYFFTGCGKFNGDDILLNIGEYKLSVTEFENMRNGFKYKTLKSQDELEAKILSEGYINAYAIANRFDTIAALRKKLDYAVRFYASTVDGYVWNKKVKPLLDITEADIKNAYSKRTSEYEMELIRIPDGDLLNKYFPNNFQVKSTANFDAIKSKIISESNIQLLKRTQKYPFYPMGIDINRLLKAKAGDAWGPFESMDGYFVVCIKDVRKANLSSFETGQKQLKDALYRHFYNKYIWENQKDILQKTSPVMNEANIKEVISQFDIKNRKWNGTDKKKVLMEYKFQGKSHLYTIDNFLEFLNNEPIIIGSLSDVNSINKMLKNNLMDIYLYAEALKMNMLKDKEYLLFRKNREYIIFEQYFREKYIDPEISVDEDEIKNYYLQNTDSFKGFKSAIVEIYKFTDNQTVSDGMIAIMNKHKKAPQGTSLPRLKNNIELPVAISTSIDFYSNTFSTNITNEIAHLKPGQISTPIKVGGEYWVIFVAGKSNQITLPYDVVKNKIKDLLSYIKKEQSFNRQLDIIKSKYMLKTNRIKQYLSLTNKQNG